MEKLLGYYWPGNVRELANVIERAAVLGAGPAIQAEHLAAAEPVNSEPNPPSGPTTYYGEVCLDGKTIDEVDEQMQRRMIDDALRKNGGNKQRADHALGLSRERLRNKLKRFGITKG